MAIDLTTTADGNAPIRERYPSSTHLRRRKVELVNVVVRLLAELHLVPEVDDRRLELTCERRDVDVTGVAAARQLLEFVVDFYGQPDDVLKITKQFLTICWPCNFRKHEEKITYQ